jgi:hypothetical protein
VKQAVSGKALVSLLLGVVGLLVSLLSLWGVVSAGVVGFVEGLGSPWELVVAVRGVSLGAGRDVALWFWISLGGGCIGGVAGFYAITLSQQAQEAIRLCGGSLQGAKRAKAGVVLGYLCFGVWIAEGIAALVGRMRQRSRLAVLC